MSAENPIPAPEQLLIDEVAYAPPPFYRVLVDGPIDPKNIVIKLQEDSRDQLPKTQRQALQQYVDNSWKNAKVNKWPNDTNPSRYRVQQLDYDGNKLTIGVAPTVSYAESLAFRNHPEMIHRFGVEAAPLDLAATTIIETQRAILVTYRKPGHDYKSGGVHITGGGFKDIRKDSVDGGPPDPIAAALREVSEELGLEGDELHGVICLGVTATPHQAEHINMVYAARTDVLVKEIRTRIHDDENDILTIPKNPEKTLDWIKSTAHAQVASGLAALVMWGRQKWGEQWYDEAVEAIELRQQAYINDELFDALEVKDKLRVARRTHKPLAPVVEKSNLRSKIKEMLLRSIKK